MIDKLIVFKVITKMLTGWWLILSKCFIIPQRWVMAIMGFLAVANAYTMRVCLNIAITQMVRKRAHSENADGGTCPGGYDIHVDSEDMETSGFDWNEETQGIILSAFYYGYIVTHLPGGMLAERFGGKYSLGLGVLSTAVFTLLTPWTVSVGGATGLIILRVLEGLGEGTTFPALNALLARWSPITERGRMGSLVFGGAQIGNIAGTYLSGLVMRHGDWESVFYLFGGLGILWFILWTVLCYNDPASHPYISDKEKKYLEEALGSGRSSLPSAIPWKAIFCSVPLWALVCAQIGHDYGYFTMVTDLPKYMTGVLKFDIHQTGTLAALPYAVMWFSSIAFGWLCDKIVKKKWLSVTNARKSFTTLASIGPGICMIFASYSGCDTETVVVLFTASMGLMGAFYPGMKVNALDLSSNFAGTIMAIVNGIGAITGIIAPYLVGLLTPDSTLVQWRLVFWITLVVFVVTNVVFVLWASAEEQWWNKSSEDTRKEIEANPPRKIQTDEVKL